MLCEGGCGGNEPQEIGVGQVEKTSGNYSVDGSIVKEESDHSQLVHSTLVQNINSHSTANQTFMRNNTDMYSNCKTIYQHLTFNTE